MAIQRIAPPNMGRAGDQRDPLLQRALEILAEREALPDKNGVYRDADLIAALQERGWGVAETSPPRHDAVTIFDLADRSHRVVVESEETRPVLLEALRRSISWQTAKEDERSFDEETRSLLGLTSEEFRRQWRDGHLDFEDPLVEHLGVNLPGGR